MVVYFACFSAYCMTEFDLAYHYNLVVKRKKRLIVLMMLYNPTAVLDNEDRDTTATLRQYMRQYTYISYPADDWLDQLLYALPLRGLIQHNNDSNANAVPLLENHKR